MPRNVRNFWIDLNVDGNKPVGTGPMNKEDGMSATINIRHEGSIYKACVISAWAGTDGKLILDVESPIKSLPEGVAFQVNHTGDFPCGFRITSKR